MDMKPQIQKDIQAAMKSGDKVKRETLRGLLATLTNMEMKTADELTQDDFITVVNREVKKRRFRKRVDNPVLFVGTGLRRALEKEGITVRNKKILTGKTPDTATIVDWVTAIGVGEATGDHEVVMLNHPRAGFAGLVVIGMFNGLNNPGGSPPGGYDPTLPITASP